MIEVLLTTPYGFVFERTGDAPYRSAGPADVTLDGAHVGAFRENVFAVFGLTPDTPYAVEIKAPNEGLCVEMRTQALAYEIDVRDYGATGDGVANDTSALNLAIYCAPEGAAVRVPAGRYLVDQVLLKSHVDIVLEEGATLVHNVDRSSLGVLKGYQRDRDMRAAEINASWEGNPLDCYGAVLYGKGVRDVRVYGGGCIDGSGAQGGWWIDPKRKRVAFRPKNVLLVGCEDVTVAGIASRNSASWNMHPLGCDRLRVLACTFQSDPGSPNTDGLNPESCRDVHIVGCRFTVGDDCIALKSGKRYMARRHRRATSGVRIRQCLMERGHGGVVVGSEISCGVRDVTVQRCLFRDTDRGLRIKTRRGRGAESVVAGIRFVDVDMQRVRHPFVINMYYNCDPDGHSAYVCDKGMRPRDAETPSVRDIRMERVRADDVAGAALFLYGLPESPIEGVAVEDCRFAFAEDRVDECPAMMDGADVPGKCGVYLCNVEGLRWRGNALEGEHVDRWGGCEMGADGRREACDDRRDDGIDDGIDARNADGARRGDDGDGAPTCSGGQGRDGACVPGPDVPRGRDGERGGDREGDHGMARIARYIDQLLAADAPAWNVEVARENKPLRWNYIDGCMMIALLRLYDATGESRYRDAARSQMDRFVNASGDVLGYDPEARALDDINGAKALVDLLPVDADGRYARAADRFLAALREQPRTEEGSFWHKRIYPNQVWLDGLYMAMPFLLAMEGVAAVRDVVEQFRIVRDRMRDAATGLYYHGYDATRAAFWADPVTGCSANFWTRSMGWFAMALVDGIERIDEQMFDERMMLGDMLRDLFDALLAVRDPASSLYHQVTDRPDAPGNYLETSGSCAIAYAMMKAARLRIVPARYAGEGERTFQAVARDKLAARGGRLALTDICLVAGLGGMPGKGDYKVRDGSVAYYVSEPIVDDDAKGVAPFLFCYAEHLRAGAARG